MSPAEKFAAHRPIKGQIVISAGVPIGPFTKVEGEICHVAGGTFIWAFHDGLNNLHE